MLKGEGRTITGSIRERKPMVIVFSIAAVLILSLAIYYVTTGSTVGPLKIFVDDEVYLDDEFDDDFDYSAFIGRKISFVEPVKGSAFVKTKEEEYFSDFDDLRFVWPIIDGLDMPNVVRGISKLVCSGTYQEAVMRFGSTPDEGVYVEPGDEYGHENKNGFIYEISRQWDSESGEEIIEIWKMYQHDHSSGGACFFMEVRMSDIPPIIVEIIKFPWHSLGMPFIPWMGEETSSEVGDSSQMVCSG